MPDQSVRNRLAPRVAANTVAQLAGKAVVLVVAAGSIAILARYLGPADYGRYGLALGITQLFGVLADAGLTTIVVRESARRPEDTESLVGNALAMRGLISLVVIALTAIAALTVPYEREVRIGLVIAGVPLLFGGLTSTITAVLQSELRMARAAIADVAGRCAAFAAVVAVVGLDLGFYAALAAAGIGALVTFGLTWALTRPLADLRPRGVLATWRRLLGASLPIGLALALNELYVRADTIIISAYRDFHDVGLYTLAYRILEVSSVLGTAFLTSVFPVMAQRSHDHGRLRDTLQTSWDAFTLLGVPVAVLGALLAERVVELAGGDGFAATAAPLRLLLVAGALAFVNGVLGYGLIAIDRQRRALWLNVAALVCNVGANLIVVPRSGIVGAATVTVASELVVLAGGLWLAHRHLHFLPSPGALPGALLASGVTAGMLALLGVPPLLVAGPLAVVLYVTLLLAVSPRGRGILLAGLGR